MKKILWIEDNTMFVRGHLKIFEKNLSPSDLEKIQAMEKDEALFDQIKLEVLEARNVFIEENFSWACKRIFEEEFDVIVLDVKFSAEPGSTSEEREAIENARELFVNAFSPSDEQCPMIEGMFDEILSKEEYSGLLLFYLICLHYEKRRGMWKFPEIKTKVCFFSANAMGPDQFVELMGQHDALKLNPQIRDYCDEVKANFWSKDDKDGLDKVRAFIEKDPHLDILEQHLGKTEKELFAKVLQTRDDETLIETNLSNLRKLQEKMLVKLANDVRSFQGMRNKHFQNGNINVRGSLKWMNDNPDSFYIRPEDVRNWESLFDVLKEHSDVISERIYDFLDYRSRRRVSDWTHDRDIDALKRFVIRDLNGIIDRKEALW